MIVIGVVVVGAAVIGLMLRSVAGRGGERDGDAAEYSEQVIAQSGAFRGDDSDSAPAWDGVERLKGVQGNDSGG